MEFITLSNKEQARIINGLVMHPLKINKDETGVLVETLRNDWSDIYDTGERSFAMQYYSMTPPGVARDDYLWHFHPGGQEDRFLVVTGAIIAAVADTRDDSPTNGLLNLFHMQAEHDPYLLLVPKRTLHGFMVVSDVPGILLNFPTRVYDPKEEVRVPHAEATIRTTSGAPFTWNAVREAFPHLRKKA